MSIKISDISNILLQDPQNKKWDKKYIDGLIKEQLVVLDYKKTFPQGLNEQTEEEEDDDIELEPEKIAIPKDEPENIIISDEPDLIPKGEEDVIDVESEPEIAPETIPIPDEPISPEIEKKQAEYTTINKEQARELLSFKGKIFQAVFTKKTDGTIRAMNGLTGVRKFTSGGELPYSPKDYGLVPVYDLKIGNASKGYRMLNLDGLKTLHMDGKKYKIDPFLKEIKISSESNPKEKQEDAFEYVSNIIKSTFNVDGNKVEVILGINPTASFGYIDKIYGTHLQDLLRGDKYTYEDLEDEIPEKFKKVGILSFNVNGEYGTTKLRNNKEQSNIQLYLKILSNVFSVAKKYFSKYDPNVIIINYPDSDIPSNIHKKRNNIYKQYIEKNSWGGYNVKEKNDILYLEKNNLNIMNEIKRMQQLAGINEIKVNNPSQKISEEIKEYLANLFDQVVEDRDGLVKIPINRSEFSNSANYDDAYLYDEAYDIIKDRGKLIIDDYDPEMTFTIDGDNIMVSYTL